MKIIPFLTLYFYVMLLLFIKKKLVVGVWYSLLFCTINLVLRQFSVKKMSKCCSIKHLNNICL